MTHDRLPLRRALVSCYDKTGLVELGQALIAADVEIVSTGSTAAQLRQAGLPVTAVEEVTGLPESFDGRVKTLHPAIHAELLADRDKESHRQQLTKLGIAAFDLLVVNLYPFSQTVAAGASREDCVEKIDIGGPAMIRAAAKNHAWLAVITSPDQYDQIQEALQSGGFTQRQRQALAALAFAQTSAYDSAVADWMAPEPDSESIRQIQAWTKLALRYGENSHQAAALYLEPSAPAGIAQAEVLQGKAMSFNNYTDGEAAYRACFDFDQTCVAIIKHANPCGIALGDDLLQAYERALACDPISAFGGVVAANRPVDAETAQAMAAIFTEVILAPSFTPDALAVLQAKPNLRVLVVPPYQARRWEIRPISGGVLLQEPDLIDAAGDDPLNWQLVAGPAPDQATLNDLVFAWRAVRGVKSNAILLAHELASVGIGMGQVNRVDACRLAVERANSLADGELRAVGAVAASDAFFPFADGPEILIAAGVKAIVQPGGSKRDQDTIAAATEAGVTLLLTGARHFYH